MFVKTIQKEWSLTLKSRLLTLITKWEKIQRKLKNQNINQDRKNKILIIISDKNKQIEARGSILNRILTTTLILCIIGIKNESILVDIYLILLIFCLLMF